MMSLFSPSGRIGRSGFWLAGLIQSVFAGVLYMAALSDQSGALLIGTLVAWLILGWCSFCSTAKRFHDRGKSALWFLISFIPFIGQIWIFVDCGLLSGDEGENRFGAPGTLFNPSGNEPVEASSSLEKFDDAYFRKLARETGSNPGTAPIPGSSVASTPVPPPALAPGMTRPAFGRRA